MEFGFCPSMLVPQLLYVYLAISLWWVQNPVQATLLPPSAELMINNKNCKHIVCWHRCIGTVTRSSPNIPRLNCCCCFCLPPLHSQVLFASESQKPMCLEFHFVPLVYLLFFLFELPPPSTEGAREKMKQQPPQGTRAEMNLIIHHIQDGHCFKDISTLTRMVISWELRSWTPNQEDQCPTESDWNGHVCCWHGGGHGRSSVTEHILWRQKVPVSDPGFSKRVWERSPSETLIATISQCRQYWAR